MLLYAENIAYKVCEVSHYHVACKNCNHIRLKNSPIGELSFSVSLKACLHLQLSLRFLVRFSPFDGCE